MLTLTHKRAAEMSLLLPGASPDALDLIRRYCAFMLMLYQNVVLALCFFQNYPNVNDNFAGNLVVSCMNVPYIMLNRYFVKTLSITTDCWTTSPRGGPAPLSAWCTSLSRV